MLDPGCNGFAFLAKNLASVATNKSGFRSPADRLIRTAQRLPLASWTAAVLLPLSIIFDIQTESTLIVVIWALRKGHHQQDEQALALPSLPGVFCLLKCLLGKEAKPLLKTHVNFDRHCRARNRAALV